MSYVAVDHFDGLIPIPNSFSSDAFTPDENAPNTFPLLWELTMLIRSLSQLRPSVPQTVSQIYRRFMVTLKEGAKTTVSARGRVRLTWP